MAQSVGSRYSAVIPSLELTSAELEYRIEASDGKQLAVTPNYSVAVTVQGGDDTKAPRLLITELVPDSTNIGSADGYEFVELYNNSDRDINLKDYKLMYRYTASGPDADVIWPTDREDILIKSGQTIVFWVINSANGSSTVADFNANYGTQLVENENIFRIYSAGMANGGGRALVIATNTRKEIAVASYDNDGETVANKGIFYKAPTDGTTQMIKTSAGLLPATPGTVDPLQVPATKVHVPDDLTAPTVANLTASGETDQGKDFELVADAQDDAGIKSVAVYYRSNLQSEYTKRYLAESYNDGMYHYKLFSPDLIGRDYIEYYFTVSDGTFETTSDKYRLVITGGRDTAPLRLNVKDGDILSGEKLLKATAEQGSPSDLKLSLDGKALQGTYASLENNAYFAFDASAVNYYFKNGVTIGQEILYTFQDPIDQYTTLTVPIEAERLKTGANTISIRAGSKTSPFDDRAEENKDDFTVRNVRLVLADGTEIYDSRFANPNQEIQMGDSAGKNEFVDFSFVLPDDKLSSATYKLDTHQLADGGHTLAVERAGEPAVTSAFQVDNTAPAVKSSVEEGREYRGAFTIDAAVTDAIAGVGTVKAWLDDKPIKLPYATASYLLTGGQHHLKIEASDLAGNTGTSEIGFSVPDELPNKPELVSPGEGATGLTSSAELAVKVSDPLQDKLNVSFYRGFKHDASNLASITAFKGAADTEPPKSLTPGGESALTGSDYAKIAKADGDYLTEDSTEAFPYHRFDINLNPLVKDTDLVEIAWQGHSLEGRKVSLYAWSPAEGAWKSLVYKIAGIEDFELKSSVAAGDYREGNTIHLMVQDKIAPKEAAPQESVPFDYSFVWMSDTQYYAESYPHIYEDIVNWIAAKKDELNIKYVFHTGDIVDDADQAYEWDVANQNMKVLEDAGLPYGVLAGNHDVDHQYGDYSYYWTHYGEDRFKDQPYYGESYKNNMGHYDLISAGGNDYIMLYMGWGLGDDEIDWMNEVLQKYPNRKAIICMHEYLLVSGNRAPIADKVFERVVMPNKNVIATLSGHYHDSELLVDGIDDDGDGVNDRNVYQMLADYQGAPEGGLGYIRLLKVDAAHNKIYVQTYSPYLKEYNFYKPEQDPGKDEFVIDLDLQPQTKEVSTDYFGVNVYTDIKVGEKPNVASGETASAVWSGLSPQTRYEWYATAEDEYGGRTLSDIWSFTTGEINPVTPTESPQPSTGPTATPTPEPVPSQAPVASPSPSATAGSAVVVPVLENGVYIAGADALSKAAGQLNGASAVEVHIPAEPAAGSDMVLRLDGAGVQAVQQRQASLKVFAGNTSVELPSAVLRQAQDAQTVTLTIRALTAAQLQAETSAATGADPALSANGAGYTFTLTLRNGTEETRLTSFAAPVTVTAGLTQQQNAGLDQDYAGVYYINGSSAQYMGGTFADGTVTFGTSHFSTFAVLDYRKQFNDLQGHWANRDVQRLAAKHVVTGVSDKLFAPSRSITRADFAVLAVKLLGYSSPAAGTSFTDVPASAYYAGYVAKAAELGLIQGYGGSFRPGDSITREEAAVMLTKLHALSTGAQASSSASAAADFTDMGSASQWAAASIRTARSLGLINGVDGSRFLPKAKVSRAEAAAMLSRMLDLKQQ
ncbi:S-layer homology domain-containing protein [Paenibacillus stellifer]|uniref:S-layer homology domain-containing protein n=1 Tax=Paenibacillus stellifer TaxID=169760 RepID=UPI003CCBC62F